MKIPADHPFVLVLIMTHKFWHRQLRQDMRTTIGAPSFPPQCLIITHKYSQ
jgi:hypothetical protein